jgi:superfamily II DNA helicase RecQ
MAAVSKVAPSKVSEFGSMCKAYGSAPADSLKPSATKFYMWLVANLGSEFLKNELVNLVRLMPDQAKRHALLETAGMMAPTASSSVFGLIGSMFSSGSSEYYNANTVKREQAKTKAQENQKASEEHAEEAKNVAEGQAKQHEEIQAKKAAEVEAKKLAAFRAKWVPKYMDQEQMSIVEIKESRSLNDMWKKHPDDDSALTRCTQYVQGLCQPGEQAIKGWHVKCINEDGMQSDIVAVLSSMSYFRLV